jgi:hypothetical protein
MQTKDADSMKEKMYFPAASRGVCMNDTSYPNAAGLHWSSIRPVYLEFLKTLSTFIASEDSPVLPWGL